MDGAETQIARMWHMPACEALGDAAKAFGEYADWTPDRALRRLAWLALRDQDRKRRYRQRLKAKQRIA